MNYEKIKDLQLNSSLYIYTVTTVYTNYKKKRHHCQTCRTLKKEILINSASMVIPTQ